MKQIIIDYDEYLMLEKAVKLVLKIEKACKDGEKIILFNFIQDSFLHPTYWKRDILMILNQVEACPK